MYVIISPIYSCITLYTLIYLYIPLYTHVYTYIPLYTHVYPCISLYTPVYPRIRLYTLIDRYIPKYILIYHYIPLYTHVYPCKPTYTHVYPRIPTYTLVKGNEHVGYQGVSAPKPSVTNPTPTHSSNIAKELDGLYIQGKSNFTCHMVSIGVADYKVCACALLKVTYIQSNLFPNNYSS